MEPNEENDELDFDEVVKSVKANPYNPDGENLSVEIVKGDGSSVVISHGGAEETEPKEETP